MTRRTVAALLALALAAALTACSGGREALTIYSGRTENLVGPLLERFHAETGIPIDVKYGDSAELALLLDTEGERTSADVFLSQTPGANAFLAGKDLLLELPAEVVERVDERFRDEHGVWVGVTGRQRVLVYNRELVEPSALPTSVDQLTQPQFAGKVAVAPTNGSFQDFVTAMRQVRGDDETLTWLRALDAGGAPTYANNNAIVDAVARGEVAMGLVNHYYNHRFLDEDPSLPSRNHQFPGDDIGSLLIPSTVSVLASTDQRDNALRFVEFLLEAQAQRYFSEETFEYPLGEGAEPADTLPPLETLEAFPYRFAELGGGLERTVELIRTSGLA
ncbi:MAG TPA: extracellular solute-binding protein [Egibacteraceae bacterium]|nr:extracellular solute-binding protein [Egibacteraceae bacterium]